MPDGYCFFHALFQALGGRTLYDKLEKKTVSTMPGSLGGMKFQSLLETYWKPFIDGLGRDGGAVSTAEALVFARAYGVNVLPVEVFYAQFGSSELNSINAANTKGWDLHYTILVDDAHAYLVYDPRARNVHRKPAGGFIKQDSLEDLEEDPYRDAAFDAFHSARPGDYSAIIQKKVPKKKVSKASALQDLLVDSIGTLPDHADCPVAGRIAKWAI